MIDITERITRVTTRSDALTPRSPAATGARVTLQFNRSVPLAAGQAVRVRYDFTGNGGHLVTFHYRLSHWITPLTLSRIRELRA